MSATTMSFFWLLLSSVAITYGSDYFGSEPIENAGDDNINDDIMTVVLYNDCTDADGVAMSVSQRQEMILDLFNCISPIPVGSGIVTGPNLSGLFFDTSDKTCMDNQDIILTDYDLCMDGVSYEPIPESSNCIEQDLSGLSFNWAIDALDGIFDDMYSYYDSPSSVDIYILDTGIRGTHVEFGGRVIDLGVYNSDDASYFLADGHGTNVASCAAGDNYGSCKDQIIYNLNIASRSTTGSIFLSNCFILMALEDSYNNMVATGKKGVINMSFVYRSGIGSSLRNMYEDLFTQIDAFGSILVAAAGNDNLNSCHYPSESDFVVSVGSYTQSFTLSGFSMYGECVDIWGPGSSVYVASVSSDSGYNFNSGTSFSSPYVAGIIANYLMQCIDESDFTQCSLDNIRNRLRNEPTTQITDFGTRCDAVECIGNIYRCGDGDDAIEYIIPDPIDECTGVNGYCDEDEAGKCLVYDENIGCSQCEPGSFKLSSNHPCVSCEETFGSSCVTCNDYIGCAQCEANICYSLYDDISQLNYCQPTPCHDPTNNCQVCNGPTCSQCKEGYTLNNDGISCS